MSPQSLAETLFPIADASATLPRSKLHSPSSPLAGWLAALWAPEDHETAIMDTFLFLGEESFVSPIDFPEPPNAPPSVHSVGSASRDDNDASERSRPLTRPHKHGLTEKEFDYVVSSLLEYLEEAELESGCDEYEYYDPANIECRLPRDLWYAPCLLQSSFYLMLTTHATRSPDSPLCLVHDSEDEDDLSEAESLETDGAYDRVSLECLGTACLVPNHAEFVSGLVVPCNATNHALCSPMATMGIPINSSLSSKEKVITMNE